MDDTTLSKFVKYLENSKMQHYLNEVTEWSEKNKLNINAEKTKEMVIDFKITKQHSEPLFLDQCTIDRVHTIKLLGLTISDDLKWNAHIDNLIKNSGKKLYFLKHLKRAGLSADDLILYYKSIIRSSLEYACQVWHSSLSYNLSHDLERIQKRALQIIYPDKDYEDLLIEVEMETLFDRREGLCSKLFKDIATNNQHKLHYLLKRNTTNNFSLRKKKEFCLPKTKTNRFRNSFINYCLFKFQ